jgi:hypothetical protein
MKSEICLDHFRTIWIERSCQAEKLEFLFTPKHGSWLNMAEIEFSALATECLNRRLPDVAALRAEVAAWECTRNENDSAIDWQFTTDDARIKLRQLYPTNHD